MAKCDFMGCNILGSFTDPKLSGKLYCNHHRSVMMRGLDESKINKLSEALDRAEYALQFIANRTCGCPTDPEIHDLILHNPLCVGLAAQNALDAIKEKMGGR